MWLFGLQKKVKFWNCASYVTYLKHCWWISREENVNKAILSVSCMVRQDDVNQIKRSKMVLARVLARLVARQKWISDAVVFPQRVFHISAFSSGREKKNISAFSELSLSLSQRISIANETRLTKVKLQRSAFVFVRSVWSASYLTRICICKTRSSANESLRWTKVKRSVLPQHVFHQGQPVSSCGCGQIRKGGQAAKSENQS